MKLLIAGGTTGGHLYPGVAVAQRWRRVSGREVLFVSARGRLDARVLSGFGFPLRYTSAGGLNNVGVRRAVAAAVRLPLGLAQGLRIVREFDPGVVLGLGGFAAGPACAAALLTGVPLVLLEINCQPGMTNRWLGRRARAVAVASPAAARHFPPGRAVCTGAPVRDGLIEALAAEAPERGDERRLRVLVLGGSQGAREINRLLVASSRLLSRQRRAVTIWHISGASDRAAVAAAYRAADLSARVEGFTDEIARAYRWADLAICQAGGGTLAELGLAGLPALLIPFSRAAEDHQAKNARRWVQAGAGWNSAAGDLDPYRLAAFLTDLARDPGPLSEMRRRASALARPDAARDVVRILEDTIT